jgi:L-lactate permease
LGLSEEDFDEISFNASVALVVASFMLVPFVFAIIVPFKMIKENLLFTFLSLCGVMLPLLGISIVSYEFPALIGGIIGLGVTAPLVHFKVGMKPFDINESIHESNRHPMDIAPLSERSVVAASSKFMTRSELPLTMDDDMADNKKEEEVITEDEERVPLTGQGESSESNVNFSLMTDEPSATTGLSTAASTEDDMTESQKAIEMALGPRKSGLPYLREFLLRTSPITLTVILLIITRIPQLGLNELLKKTEPAFSIYFGTYATFRLSASLVFQLDNILTYPNLDWKYELLYTPFIIPFILVSMITYLIYRKESSDSMGGIFRTVYSRVKNPAVALAGALTLVQLMTEGDETAPASIIGTVLADALQGGWIAISASIGALGSFFSGSTTVANLTFGSVQQVRQDTALCKNELLFSSSLSPSLTIICSSLFNRLLPK